MLVKKKNLEFYECDEFVALFVAELEAAGVVADFEEVPPSPYRASATHVYLSIQIDPETLRQIFEYAIALLGAHKATSYLQSFLTGVATGAGKPIGERIGEAFTSLWKRIFDAIWKPQKDESRGIDLLADVEFEGVPIRAYIGGFFSGTLEKQDKAVNEFMRDLTFHQLLSGVLPIAGEFILRAKELGIEISEVSARLYPTKEKGGAWSLWLWQLDILPVGYFVLEEEGRLLPRDQYAYYERGSSANASGLAGRGFDPSEVGRILEQYRESNG